MNAISKESSPKTKILLVSPLPPPSGGISTWSKAVLEMAATHGQIEISHIDTAVRWRSTNDFSFFKRVIGGTFQAFRDILRIYHAIKNAKPHLIHLCTSASLATPRDILILYFVRVLGVRSIVHYHFGRLPAIIADNTWEWKMIRRAMKLADTVVLLDNKSGSSVINALPDVSVELIPNPIDMKMINKLLFQGEKQRSANNLLHIVYAGHVIPTKGICELVDACTLIEGYSFDLHLVGPTDDEFRKTLEGVAAKRNRGQWLRFHGMMSRQDAMGYIRDADIFVLPSYTEGFPNVVLEAMALGKPIIATRVGAIPEMLDEGTDSPCGLVILPQSVDELCDALLYFIKHPAKARTCGEWARKKVMSSYSINRVMEHYLELWRSLANRS